MDKESDVIRHQMEQTRSALTDKLEVLEHQVTETVTGAAETVEKVRHTVQDTVTEAAETVERVRSAVHDTVSGAADTVASMKHALQDTVQSVKDSVRETAETVSETLDIRRQVENHPWAMMAGATAVGFGVGMLVTRVDVPAAASSMASSARSMASNWAGSAEHISGWSESRPQANREHNGRRERQESQEDSPWAPAVNKLKGLAIGAMFGVLREVVSKSMPEALSGHVGEVIDGLTDSLGGKKISGKILPASWTEGSDDSEEEGSESWQSPKQTWQGGSRRPRQTAMADVEE